MAATSPPGLAPCAEAEDVVSVFTETPRVTLRVNRRKAARQRGSAYRGIVRGGELAAQPGQVRSVGERLGFVEGEGHAPFALEEPQVARQRSRVPISTAERAGPGRDRLGRMAQLGEQLRRLDAQRRRARRAVQPRGHPAERLVAMSQLLESAHLVEQVSRVLRSE